METLAPFALKNIDEAIASRMAIRTEAERKRQQEDEDRLIAVELGKEPFREALINRLAREYKINVSQNPLEVVYSHGGVGDLNFTFRLAVNAEPVEGVEIEAWLSPKWALSADYLLRQNPRDTVWIARRRGFFDGPDEEPVTVCAEFSDFVEALIWAKYRL